MPAYHAHDHVDYLFAGAVAAVLLAVVVFFGRPAERLALHEDESTLDEVQDIFQAVVELRIHDSEAFAGFVGRVAPGRIMIGTAADCVGTYGTQCKDAFLSDYCYDVSQTLAPYLSPLPVDESSVDFSAEKTGYYLEVRDRALVVGACDPEGRETIELTYPL